MDIGEKLEILASAAKYDVSCSSSGSKRQNNGDGLGNAASSGICHSWSDDGRCVSLLKILFSNHCIYDCSYCVNRFTNDIPRASFTPREVADLTINFYKRNYIEGLFLSSAVFHNPDYTMEKIVKTVKILREDYKFNGYIHLKAIPGADYTLIEKAGRYADRMSVNIELPSEKSLTKLAPQKKAADILNPMQQIGEEIKQNRQEKKKYKKAPTFVPAGQSTQLIVGASPEPDYQILKLSEGLYDNYNLKRVYYSAYVPINNEKKLPALPQPPLLREHRLYQADWLLRYYGFEADELLGEERPNFNHQFDPKVDWALHHPELFPVEINKAPYHTLVRIPGIGPRSAKNVISARKTGSLDYLELKKMGSVLKRAQYFITCKGKYYAGIPYKPELIKKRLSSEINSKWDWNQLALFAGDNPNE